MRIAELLENARISKDIWTLLLSNDEKLELGDELIDLVQNAYRNTRYGPMINSPRELLPSDWNVLDWDSDPGLDACVFFRTQRDGEPWVGHKIQGIGHDGKRYSKDAAIKRLNKLLSRHGWWIESSDAMRSVLQRGSLRAVTDERLLQQLFPESNLTMISDDTYQRTLANGDVITETVFGNPIIRGDLQ